MKRQIIIFILAWLPLAASSENLLDKDYRKISSAEFGKLLPENLTDLNVIEISSLVQKVVSSERVDLALILMENHKTKGVFVAKIRDLPTTKFKVLLITEALKNKELWIEKQKVNKGEQFRLMASLCSEILTRFFPEDLFGWAELSDHKIRLDLASSLEKALKNKKLGDWPKKDTSSLPLHQPGIDNSFSFDNGWID